MHDLTAGTVELPNASAHPAAHSTVKLLCLALAGEAAGREELAPALRDPAVRDQMVRFASRAAVAPALHDALMRFADDLPKAERVRLALEREGNRRRNREIRDAVLEIAAEANRRSVEIIALKGAAWIFEDPEDLASWRWLGDADVLVMPAHLTAMGEVLAGLGYRPARRERTMMGKLRFAGHYHLIEHKRGGASFAVEAHRDIGWRPELLPTETIFAHRRSIAPGLSLPCPWHAALHAIIHWQIHHYGYQRGLGVNAALEIARFLKRPDVDWSALIGHAARLGIEREVHAALALTAASLQAPVPAAVELTHEARAYAARVLERSDSRARSLAAKEHTRVLRLWDDDRLRYRMSRDGHSQATMALALSLLRLRRLPFIAAHLVAMVLLRGLAALRARYPGLRLSS